MTGAPTYPDAAGWKGEPTSLEAAGAIEASGKAEQLRVRVRALFDAGRELTADECALELQEDRLAIRPRLSELHKQGIIQPSGTRRRNASGKDAQVWRAVRQVSAPRFNAKPGNAALSAALTWTPPAQTYNDFIMAKRPAVAMSGLARVPYLSDRLFPHQRMAADFLLRIGRGAQFLDTGLGKSAVSLCWSQAIVEAERKPALILTPLAVAPQFVKEGAAFGIEARHLRDQSEVTGPGIYVSNYERLERFDPSAFVAVAADESGILKSYTGVIKSRLIEMFSRTPFRIAGTATPAPNDYMELGNHSAFLGIMESNEMLSRWFINDTSAMGRYRLKNHAIDSFWEWVASWAVCAGKPSDLDSSFSDSGYVLPPFATIMHDLRSDPRLGAKEGELIASNRVGIRQLQELKRATLSERVALIAALVNGDAGEPWAIWCDTDAESSAFTAAIPDAVEVKGSLRDEVKEERLIAFSEGRARVIVTKARIAGFGLNWQHCARVAFGGFGFSYESFYQAIRRFWRFGQTREVQVHLPMSASERAAWAAIAAKRERHEQMKRSMFDASRRARATVHQVKTAYAANCNGRLPSWLTAA